MELRETKLVTLIFTTIAALIFILSISAQAKTEDAFVRVSGTQFTLQGKPYQFLGTNFWYGMNLGMNNMASRARLVRELDRLKILGVTNLRILGMSEGPSNEPWRIIPAAQNTPGQFSEPVLEGLDFLLTEMAKRNMHAVVCLSNFWPWSGGMAQYVKWNLKNSIPYPPPHPGGSWDTYQIYTAQFYSNEAALRQYEAAITKVITRTNTITKKPYKEDPTIMAWQLANEPRGIQNVLYFNRWINTSAGLIKSMDPNHLVTTGVEGETPNPQSAGLDLIENHSSRNIDYVTVHIWAQNWGWYDPMNASGTYENAARKMKEYLLVHVQKAKTLGKPLVLEEFGISRDLNSHDPASPTTIRDRYYREVFETVLNEIKKDSPLRGVNFWAWSGEGFPAKPYGGFWKAGDPFTGDPPHETQGWYSVYHTDKSTLDVISEFARKISL
ncbi:MAG: mannanase [Bdellovibrionales bacterium]